MEEMDKDGCRLHQALATFKITTTHSVASGRHLQDPVIIHLHFLLTFQLKYYFNTSLQYLFSISFIFYDTNNINLLDYHDALKCQQTMNLIKIVLINFLRFSLSYFFSSLSNIFAHLAGSKFPFVNNNMQQNQMQSNWPGMHMGFNQNTNDGFPPHQNNQQQPPQQQHKPAGNINNITENEALYTHRMF
jgi:hypothetical protein